MVEPHVPFLFPLYSEAQPGSSINPPPANPPSPGGCVVADPDS